MQKCEGIRLLVSLPCVVNDTGVDTRRLQLLIRQGFTRGSQQLHLGLQRNSLGPGSYSSTTFRRMDMRKVETGDLPPDAGADAIAASLPVDHLPLLRQEL